MLVYEERSVCVGVECMISICVDSERKKNMIFVCIYACVVTLEIYIFVRGYACDLS
jgi:hypothetical protein